MCLAMNLCLYCFAGMPQQGRALPTACLGVLGAEGRGAFHHRQPTSIDKWFAETARPLPPLFTSFCHLFRSLPSPRRHPNRHSFNHIAKVDTRFHPSAIPTRFDAALD